MYIHSYSCSVADEIRSSIRRPVFALVFVFKHIVIGIVARLGYIMVFYGFEHSAAGLMGVSAVAETATRREAEYLAEIMTDLLGFHVEGAEAFDARGVDGPTTERQTQHLAERGGVRACIVRIGNLGGAQMHAGDKAVEQG